MTDLLTVPEAAERLAVSRSQVYRYIATGDLAHIDLGTARRPLTRIARDDLERFVNHRTTRRN